MQNPQFPVYREILYPRPTLGDLCLKILAEMKPSHNSVSDRKRIRYIPQAVKLPQGSGKYENFIIIYLYI